ncbi:GNAT family N-acetyltransferase [Cellulosilyticum lentocellum]|uniref:GCN5-related N-acetyltransferase n=1 Tax=Cellulosilyticum lentocellum (strain ATCC 49066 / DSM 5427 / NCIMB 11756 / RHM5) TaxID=642492 RepID=F2JQK1_CELLD|nr:GNAT family N-acetyltransferase [Cellulosilyticum lentocellum]ADZ84985.1 GCN5-related N-acetyltransferase [Cellulosilyticum lentocellum DSM 5427]
MEYRALSTEEMDLELFKEFKRHQVVTKCWRKIDGNWVVKDNPFEENWGEEEYRILIKCLKHTLETGGIVFGAFKEGILKGISSVESEFFGSNQEYLDLSSIHVSEEMRGMGIGKQLFQMASTWAREKGAKKLYISAHSSIESQAFYKAMGCVEALEYNKEHVEKEPCDCQLEYIV